MYKKIPALIALLLSVLITACAGAFAADEPQATLPQSELVIDTVRGPVTFTVEMAATPRQQERGLMFRQHVAPDEGMLFDFQRDGDRLFWMKNTLIPLDMIFIRSDGTIANIAANTVPLSETTVASAGPVRGVLEIAGGRAAQAGIKAGDHVRHPIFVKAPAPKFP